MDKVSLELFNPEFEFGFAGKQYKVRRASLVQGIKYQEKVYELLQKKEPAIDLKLVAYCIYLILSGSDPTITEDFVLSNTPADINVVDTLTKLGFMNPSQKETVQNLMKKEE